MRRRPEPAILIQTQLLFVPKANQTITTQHTKLSCNIKNGEVKNYLWQHLFWCLFSFCYVVILKFDTKNLSRNIKKCNKSLKYGLIWAMETIYENTLLFLQINVSNKSTFPCSAAPRLFKERRFFLVWIPVNFRLRASQRFIRRRLEPKEQKEKKARPHNQTVSETGEISKQHWLFTLEVSMLSSAFDTELGERSALISAG